MRWMILITVSLLLSTTALLRASFSEDAITIPLPLQASSVTTQAEELLQQPYHYLGEGRQAIVFESKDGKVVLKFFKKAYIEDPWYLPFLKSSDKEKKTRSLRRMYFRESYLIAEQSLKEETGLFYVHFGETSSLSKVHLRDKAHREMDLDINRIPFVLQKKGTPLYDAIRSAAEPKRLIDAFYAWVDHRISLNISDADHDVQLNFGVVDGNVFQMDPGRLLRKDLSNPEEARKERWRATHRFAKWLSCCAE